MAYFRWNGLTSKGSEAQGLALAASIEAAQLSLMYHGIAVLKISNTSSQSRRARKRFLHELMVKLAVLTSHGLALHQALGIVNSQTSNPHNKANIETLHREVCSGNSLAESIGIHFPETSPYAQALIKSGEESGRIGPMLQTLATHLEQQAALRKKIIAAATAPLMTLLFTAGIIMVLLIAVVPQFERLFTILEKPMPPATASLIAVAHALQSPLFLLLIACLIGSCVALYHLASRLFWLRKAYDSGLLYLPLIGNIIVRLELSHFLSMIGVLCDATLPLHRAAALATTSTNNVIIAGWLEEITNELKHGKTLVQAVTMLPHYSRQELHDLLAPTVTLGIKQKTLALATQSLEQDALKSLTRIIAIIGPTLLIVVGGVIFSILIFLYLPLFNLANSI